MPKRVEPKPNPAVFNDAVLKVIERNLRRQRRLLDPFAGTGKGVDYMVEHGHSVVGVELEPEWACQSKYVEVGNALQLRWRASSFDGIFTSCTYGNRMADHHNAQEVCKACKGTGWIGEHGPKFQDGKLTNECEKCGGKGKRVYKRHTYKHYLGRDLSPDNSGAMQWGPEYQDFHQRAWKEADRVLRRGGRFVLNIKDHERGGEWMPVTEFHRETLLALGLKQVRHLKVETQGLRHGENYELRAEYESVIVFDKVA